MNVAIVGLGRVGSEFLQEMLQHSHKGVKVMCVAEPGETPGKELARRKSVRILTVEEILGLGETIDIIFDLTGVVAVRKQLRQTLEATQNRHTVIAPETMAQIIWTLLTDRELPAVHGHMGY
ncbi:MAG: hypothetical protein K2Q10_03220 [Rhodospirillales bacterium]|nr:hypothetical protein [Rhodospirillales bacterium]